jgi:hypothetical protein
VRRQREDRNCAPNARTASTAPVQRRSM